MNLALQAWKDGNLKRARELLRDHAPKQGERAGFEWRYLSQLCRDESVHTISPGPNGAFWRLETTPAHSFVATCTPKGVFLLDPDTGEERQRIPFPNEDGRKTWDLLALASGATNLLAIHHADGLVGLWDIVKSDWLARFPTYPQGLSALALSSDSRLLAAQATWGYSNSVAVWDLSSPTSAFLLWTMPWAGSGVLRFSPDGQTLVTNGKPIRRGGIGVYEARTGQELALFPKCDAEIHDAAFSPDGTLLATAGVQSRVNVWNFADRSVKLPFDGHSGGVKCLAFSPDGRRLISGGADGTIRLWDLVSGRSAGMLRDPQNRELRGVAFAPDGRFIHSTTGDELRLWSTTPREPATVLKNDQQWGRPAVSPDGQWLVTIAATFDVKDYSETEAAKVWDLHSGQERFHLRPTSRQPTAVAFSPDGRFLVLGGESHELTVDIWDTALWDRIAAPPVPTFKFTNLFEVGSIAFSPDGKTMALAGLCFGPEKPTGATNRLAFFESGPGSG
jgi:WD40 repeat protein